MEDRNSPLTDSRTAKFILGSVFTWHSYLPWSLGCTLMILRVHISEPGLWSTSNLESDVYVSVPEVRMWRSRVRIQDTCNKKTIIQAVTNHNHNINSRKTLFVRVNGSIVILYLIYLIFVDRKTIILQLSILNFVVSWYLPCHSESTGKWDIKKNNPTYDWLWLRLEKTSTVCTGHILSRMYLLLNIDVGSVNNWEMLYIVNIEMRMRIWKNNIKIDTRSLEKNLNQNRDLNLGPPDF